ncbi:MULTISPECIES: PACE efflux transporter [Aeromonas]|uniref:PACE efflux transporter n=1 Tax=Aeromonas TaxID=642 RepID=UPI002B05AF2E|nr:PACE efflux transporter [Aeromonas jandaei]
MRTRNDRIRQAIGFEVIGLFIAAPLASWATGIHLSHMGPLALFFSVMATLWNYIYNIGVDKLLLKYQGHTYKNVWQRVVHAIGFEGGLLTVALPAMAWWLNVSMLEALVLDLGFVAFYLVYAFVYNWVYDKVFPIPVESMPHLQQNALG